MTTFITPTADPRTVAPGRPVDRPQTVVGIGVLGSLRVIRHGCDVTPSQPKLRQFLALLAVNTGQVVHIDSIVEEMWGGEPTARHCRKIQTYVSELRKLLAAPAVSATVNPPVAITHVPRIGYSLRLGPGGRIDLVDFRRLVNRVIAENPDGIETWLNAVDRPFRGAPLDDIVVGSVLSRVRGRIDDERVAVLQTLIERRLADGDVASIGALASRVREVDVRHESLHVSLLRVLGDGSNREAAAEYSATVRAVAHERNVALGPELRRLVQQPAGGGPLTAQVRTGRPEKPAVPTQLPLDPLPFVGFEGDLARAAAVLGEPRPVADRATVVTVVGGPGSGKSAFCTRLCEQVSARYPDGQLYADLRHRTVDEALVGFLQSLGVETVPRSRTEQIRVLRRVTAGSRILVFVDGVAGPEATATLIPAGPDSALVIGSMVRPPADLRTHIVELRRLTPDERLAVFERRIGADRLATELDHARQALASTDGLPLAVNILAGKALMRPHWSIRKLADRACRWQSPASFWQVLGMDLHGSVHRALEALDPALAPLARTLISDPVSAHCTVREATALLGVAEEVAEIICEALVEFRLADAVAMSEVEPDRLVYRVPALYRIAVRAEPPPVR